MHIHRSGVWHLLALIFFATAAWSRGHCIGIWHLAFGIWHLAFGIFLHRQYAFHSFHFHSEFAVRLLFVSAPRCPHHRAAANNLLTGTIPETYSNLEAASTLYVVPSVCASVVQYIGVNGRCSFLVHAKERMCVCVHLRLSM